MKVYKEFHGNILISNIGKRLREIVKIEKNDFKILTGYGSVSNVCESKKAALNSLRKMKKEGLIKDFLPGEVKNQILNHHSSFLDTKLTYESRIKRDKDYGNEGVIYIFIV